MTDFTFEGLLQSVNPSSDFAFTEKLGVLISGSPEAKFHINSGSAAEMFRLENDTGRFQFNVTNATTIELKNVATGAQFLQLASNGAGDAGLFFNANGETSKIWLSDADTLNISRANSSTAALVISVAGDLSLESRFIKNVLDPVNPQDVATKTYVDAVTTELQAQDLDTSGDSGTGNVDLDTQAFAITGLSGLTTAAANQGLTIDLDDTAVTPGSYGDGTNIPTLTIDQQGRITAASNNSVATSLGTSGDSGTGSIALLTQVLAVTGLSGITTVAAAQGVTVDLDDTAVTPGSYGDTTNIPSITVDQQGRLTAASNNSVATSLSTSGDSGTGSIALLTQSLAVTGLTGITTVAATQGVTVDLDDTAVTPASYGSATSIPSITVDQQGRITAASGNTISSTLDIAADGGTDDGVLIGTDTLSILGTANEITTAVTGDTITISQPTDVTVGGDLTVSGGKITLSNGSIIDSEEAGKLTLTEDLIEISGNLSVTGTTTTFDSTTVSVQDPIFEMGDSTSDDNLDRGIIMKYNSSGAKIAFMGFDDSDGKFTVIPVATDTSSVITGTQGILKADIEGTLTGQVASATQSSITSIANLTTVGAIGTGSWAATDVAILHGGTGASTDSGARTNLGVAIGQDVQAYSAQNAFRTDKLSVFAATTSAELFGVISDETGSGAGTPLLVFNQSPTIVTPTIASMTNAQHSHTNAAGGGTITEGSISDLGTLTAMVADNLSVFAATTSSQLAGVISDETGSGALVFASSPALTTPGIGAATGTSLDAGGTTLYASRAITVDTGGVLNVVLASASGDDFTVDTSKLVVEGDTGNVGIGTATPTDNLTVAGIAGASGHGSIEVMTNTGATDAGKWRMRSNTDNAFYIDNKGTGSYTQKLKLSRTGSVDTLAIAAVDAFQITEGSTNVHIPGSLTVAGSVSSVTNPAGDVEFDGGYIFGEQGRVDNVANTTPGVYYRFNGTADYINLGASSIAAVKHSDYTISAWIYPTGDIEAVHTTRTIIGDNDNDHGTTAFKSNSFVMLDIFGENPSFGRIRFSGHSYFEDDGSTPANRYNWNVISSNAAVVPNKWQHICAIVDRDDATKCKIFVNGADVTARPGDSSFLDTHVHAEGDLVSHDWQDWAIGRRNYTNSAHFDGSISKIQQFNLALSDTEVKEMYSGASIPFKYKSASSISTVTGESSTFTTDSSASFPGDWAQYVNGNGDTVSDWSGAAGGGIFEYEWGTAGNGAARLNNVTVVGKRYKLTLKAKLASGAANWGIGSQRSSDSTFTGDNNNAIAFTFTGTETVYTGYFTAVGTDIYISQNPSSSTSASTIYIDDFSIVQIGAVAEYDARGLTRNFWMDVSGNGLTGTVTGPTPSEYDGHGATITDMLSLIEEKTTVAPPPAGQGGRLYTKTNGRPYWISDDMVETDLTTTSSNSAGWTASTGKVVTTNTGDNVGIGNSTFGSFIGSHSMTLNVSSAGTASTRAAIQIEGSEVDGNAHAMLEFVDNGVSSGYIEARATAVNIIAAGGVGIGVTDPAEALEVNGNIMIGDLAKFVKSGTVVAIEVGGSYNKFQFTESALASPRMTIDYSTSRVGIMNAAPDEVLHVTGNIKVSGNYLAADGTVVNTAGSDSFWTASGSDISKGGGSDKVGINCTTSVGGAPGAGLGVLNAITTATGTWAGQFRGDHAAANGIFVRAGSTSSQYVCYMTGGDETDERFIVRSDGLCAINTGPDTDVMLTIKALGMNDWGVRVLDSGGDQSVGLFVNGSGAGELRAFKNDNTTVGLRLTAEDDAVSYFNGGGNVGIGTDSPAEMLHIYNATTSARLRLQTAASSQTAIEFKRTAPSTQEWKICDGESANGTLEIYDITDSRSVMAFDGDGDVGIGTATPGFKLDVNGDINCTSIRVGGTIYDASNLSAYWSQTGNDIYYNYNVGIGTASPDSRLHVQDASLRNVSLTYGTAATAVIRGENAELAIGTEDSDPWAMFIQARSSSNAARDLTINPLGGNVGIGTTTPDYNLEVESNPGSTGTTEIAITQSNQPSDTEYGQATALVFNLRKGVSGDIAKAGMIKVGKSGDWHPDGESDSFMDFYTTDAGTNTFAMRIDKDGKVGIGTVAPGQLLTLSAATGAHMSLHREDADSAIVDGDDLGSIQFTGRDPDGAHLGAYIIAEAAADWGTHANDKGTELQFFTQTGGGADNGMAAPRMTIDMAGKVGIGVADPGAQLTIGNTADDVGAYMSLENRSNQTITAGAILGQIYFQGDDNDMALAVGSIIRAKAAVDWGDDSSSLNDAPTNLEFYVQSNDTTDDLATPLIIMEGYPTKGLTPGADNITNLGSDSKSWDNAYGDGWSHTSDKRFKDNISDSVLGLDFINKLRPVSYKKKDTETLTYVRKHYGLIAQEVKSTLDDLDIDTKDFAGYVDANVTGEADRLFLKYTEFIAPMMKAIQELSAKVEALEAAAAK